MAYGRVTEEAENVSAATQHWAENKHPSGVGSSRWLSHPIPSHPVPSCPFSPKGPAGCGPAALARQLGGQSEEHLTPSLEVPQKLQGTRAVCPNSPLLLEPLVNQSLMTPALAAHFLAPRERSLFYSPTRSSPTPHAISI